MKSYKYIVRRLAAIEGCAMCSKDEKEEPFVLEKNQCWVLSDNENLKPEVDGILLSNNLIISLRLIILKMPGVNGLFALFFLSNNRKQGTAGTLVQFP